MKFKEVIDFDEEKELTTRDIKGLVSGTLFKFRSYVFMKTSNKGIDGHIDLSSGALLSDDHWREGPIELVEVKEPIKFKIKKEKK